jgi:DmsE family decaheme c-type cytochrome
MHHRQAAMTFKHHAARALLLLAMLLPLAGRPALAADEAGKTETTDAAAAKPAAPAKPAAAAIPLTQYSAKGADTCLECHDADNDTASFVNARIFKTRHAQRHNTHAPFGKGGLQCEACHGPGARHSLKGDKKAINSQKADSFLPVAERNQACLSCHQDRARHAWQGSSHERANLACADCHKLHNDRDPALNKATEAEVCYACHRQQRADFLKTSAHPVRQGRMACSDCHASHGSSTPAMLRHPTLNQTCTSCHAEKRGPVLWEHAPVSEDCALCHTPHGAPRQALLTKSPPLLCQQCHAAAGHPAVARTSNSLPGGSAAAGGAAYLVAGGCINCHSQVHGSNHPSGVKLMR